MKIAVVSTTEKGGGAGIAAHRFFKELSKKNDVKFFVKEKVSINKNVVYINGDGLKRVLSKVSKVFNRILKIFLKTENKVLHSAGIFYSSFDINILKKFDPDVIHLHWVNGGFLSIKDIVNIIKLGKPVVWTLHDMWAFCGAEHYTMGDMRYRSGYVKNNRPKHEVGLDINRLVWGYKMKYKKYFEKITYVTPSNWLAQCALESDLLAKADIHVIHNGLDINVFQPVDKILSRKELGLPVDKKIILFGALNATKDKRKGYIQLCESLHTLKKQMGVSNMELVVFGNDTLEDGLPDISTTHIGKINDINKLILLYSAADLFIAPSLEDNLPNTVVESLSCATPVVGFDIGGMSDMIVHKNNGYLASAKDTNDMSSGIVWCLKRVDDLSQKSYEKFLLDFDVDKQTQKYIDLYKEIIK